MKTTRTYLRGQGAYSSLKERVTNNRNKISTFIKKKQMVFQTDDIKKMSAKEKADLYYLLRDDEGLKEYMLSNESLEEEINRRDTAFAEGKIQLTNREQLTLRLKNRREAI